MADSTVLDVTKMKVIDLRKELKSRGLSYVGDKAELVSRLQSAISQDEHGDITLDSDEMDSDGVLEDEDDKSHEDILDDPAVDTLNEELALSDQPPTTKTATEPKPQRTLKRKITATNLETSKETSEQKPQEEKEVAAKKIILHRSPSITSAPTEKAEETEKPVQEESKAPSTNKVRITADVDTKSKLELRAKRFGLPVKMSENERKEARKQRFGQSNSSVTKTVISSSGSLTENMEKLRKRAERFGQSVSKIMTDIEKKEQLEKRKAKFGTVA